MVCKLLDWLAHKLAMKTLESFQSLCNHSIVNTVYFMVKPLLITKFIRGFLVPWSVCIWTDMHLSIDLLQLLNLQPCWSHADSLIRTHTSAWRRLNLLKFFFPWAWLSSLYYAVIRGRDCSLSCSWQLMMLSFPVSTLMPSGALWVPLMLLPWPFWQLSALTCKTGLTGHLQKRT